MRNGQLKPGYNVQFAVNSEFITEVDVYSNRTDYGTRSQVLNRVSRQHGKRYRRVVADSGYESLSNYRYLEEYGQEAYIKLQNYERRKTKKFKEQIGRAENMAYYEPKDCFMCKNEQTYRPAYSKAEDPEKPKEIVICWKQTAYREAALERISIEEGKLLRVNRSIQVEGTLGN